MPLILVARDLSKLQFVADDIETHYGVSCKVLRADLSEPGCARKVHAATTRAGLVVDVLVNNAGVCARGDLSGDDDEEEEDVAERMIRVNAMATTGLSRLYGRDMRGRRRGRILVVSSVSGVLPGCPSVGVYAATKAFGRSLANSLGREMERCVFLSLRRVVCAWHLEGACVPWDGAPDWLDLGGWQFVFLHKDCGDFCRRVTSIIWVHLIKKACPWRLVWGSCDGLSFSDGCFQH
ncbi:hypothetical protein ACHAWF_012046 [Thalassiosira exigua]